jgi:phosphoglycerol transferase MdoB-like AlkP superfamily enzyme
MNVKVSARQALNSYYSPVFLIAFASITISTLTRLLLLVKSSHGVDWTFTNIAGLFTIGLFYDLVIASYVAIPILLHLWFLNEGMYKKTGRWLVPVIYLVIIAVLLFSPFVNDFNGALRNVFIGLFTARLAMYFGLLLAGERFRRKWRKWVLLVELFVIVYLLLFNAVSEWFFWDEFSTRYNFIAVDYLVYTNEVVGNIRESYPLGWIIAGVCLLALTTVRIIYKPVVYALQYRPGFGKRTLMALALLVFPTVAALLVNNSFRKFSDNQYVNELAGNGTFEFGTAFRHNELDFFSFYHTLSDSEAFSILREQLTTPNSRFTSNDPFNIEREISYTGPEKRMNVVMISVESLSGDFMKAFGNTNNITPQLDSLAGESLFFTNLYASGTRTVRGLEALSLSIPPTPGQSVVKRPANENLFSLGSVFTAKGYATEYIYGGYGYFDNMQYFFSNNGYKVVDREAIKPEAVHYANVWGVADEDLFTLALQEMDHNYNNKKPFFAQVMTVSNHRPYTYPDGRIDIPPSTQSREGAVKYTDYAIGKFLREARLKPWFSNTIFVIVSDHCAGSAGSVALPVTGYHIPMLIYSPGNIQPAKVDKLTAQIDVAPTILGLLQFNYKSKFFGQDIFALPAGRERAFISTYQGLGYLRNGRLVLQSPVKKLEEFVPDFATGQSTKAELTDSLVKQATAYYQCASWLIKNKKYGK